ncbi:hypothetical protein MLD38_027297 [Melastoma candidum]|uniref:Uncharacterized protein n=1 Tax=Melastoma candidum TaxID=119954 RepID=A0ACB9P285_9MYRT|nr:hypothetical protein MLD38_027297 [Melastoma candidum]
MAALSRLPFTTVSQPKPSSLPVRHLCFRCPTRPPSLSVSCSSLIDPDGGKLVDFVVEEPLRNSRKFECLGLPRVKLSRIDLQWSTSSRMGGPAPSPGSCDSPSSSKLFLSAPSASRTAPLSTCLSPSSSPSTTRPRGGSAMPPGSTSSTPTRIPSPS